VGPPGAWRDLFAIAPVFAVFAVLDALTADLHGDDDQDHGHDHADPAERRDQSDVLADRFGGGEKHRLSLPAEIAPVS
jgi:hypothetical protein